MDARNIAGQSSCSVGVFTVSIPEARDALIHGEWHTKRGAVGTLGGRKALASPACLAIGTFARLRTDLSVRAEQAVSCRAVRTRVARASKAPRRGAIGFGREFDSFALRSRFG